MSLTVYLTLDQLDLVDGGRVEQRIYVRRDGATVEVSRAEWEQMHPGRTPVTVAVPVASGEVYSANITHNLGRMARECRLHTPLWQHEKLGATARDLIEPLRAGLELLRSDRARFEQFNPPNGWGDYDLLVRFSADYLAACERWPGAEVHASR